MAEINDVNTITAAFLAAAIRALDLTDEGPPGRVYVSPGEPALDCCGQLTVWTQSITEIGFAAGEGALANANRLKRGGMPQLLIYVQATRCQIGLNRLSESELPDPADLQATAMIVDQDGWALRCHMAWELRHGELAEICRGVEMLGGQKLTPEGGCVGWTFQFQYPLEAGVLAT